MQRNWQRAVLCAVTMPTASAVLSGCVLGGGPATVGGLAGPAGPAVSITAPASSPATSATPAASGDDTASPPAPTEGCAAGGDRLPEIVNSVETPDLDGDGEPDNLWLGVKGNTRMLGVRTASGARFATSFTSATPTAAAVAGRLADGSAIILLDFTQEAKLYAVVDCAIVQVRNAQGNQYTFDRGSNGFGSGVGCPVIGSLGQRLVGYLAEPGGFGDGYTVTRTTINLSKNGTRALNGTVKTVGTGLPASNSKVKTAQTVTCGTADRVREPAS
jgi:hypothetical protein